MVSLSVPSWQPRRRLLAIALSISLVANLFLGGLTLGWLMHLNLWPWPSSYVTEFGSQTGRAIEHLVRNPTAPTGYGGRHDPQPSR